MRDLRQAAAHELTERFGRGHWSMGSTLPTLRRQARAGQLYVVERKGEIVATFRLSPRKIGLCRKCGYRRVHCSAVGPTRLEYYETVLDPRSSS